MKRSGLILVLMLLANILGASPAFAANLSQTELKTQIIGKFLHYNKENTSGHIKYKTNGRLSVVTSNNRFDKGRWFFKQNKICTTGMLYRGGATTCFNVSKTGLKRYRTSHGFRLRR